MDDLGEVAQAKSYVDLAGRLLDKEVALARRAGVTWLRIGQAVGMTHQGARARWAPVLKALDKTQVNPTESANGHAARPDSEDGGVTWPSPPAKSPS